MVLKCPATEAPFLSFGSIVILQRSSSDLKRSRYRTFSIFWIALSSWHGGGSSSRECWWGDQTAACCLCCSSSLGCSLSRRRGRSPQENHCWWMDDRQSPTKPNAMDSAGEGAAGGSVRRFDLSHDVCIYIRNLNLYHIDTNLLCAYARPVPSNRICRHPVTRLPSAARPHVQGEEGCSRPRVTAPHFTKPETIQ